MLESLDRRADAKVRLCARIDGGSLGWLIRSAGPVALRLGRHLQPGAWDALQIHVASWAVSQGGKGARPRVFRDPWPVIAPLTRMYKTTLPQPLANAA